MYSARYVLIGGSLYRRGYTEPLLKCLKSSEAEYILKEIHEGVCGNHSGSRMLAHKAMRAGYYWPTMNKDSVKLVRKCDKCQRFARVMKQPPEKLSPITSPWPFAKWGVDIVGPMPPGKGGRKFLLVAVDYFTKWAEAEALATITTANVGNSSGIQSYVDSVSHTLLLPTTENSSTVDRFENGVPNSVSEIITQPQYIHRRTDKWKLRTRLFSEH
jgi:hypothetical protein